MTTDDPDRPDEPSAERQPEDPDAKRELFEAIDHFKNAASILFDRATNDPAVKSATTEAERVIQKLGTTAEPLARQLTGELSRLTKRVTETVEGRRKSESPPPDEEDGGDDR